MTPQEEHETLVRVQEERDDLMELEIELQRENEELRAELKK